MKVLVAVDDTPYSEVVLAAISRRRWPSGTQFKILTVLEPISLDDLDGAPWLDLVHDVTTRRQHSAEKLCARARERIQAHVAGAIVHYEIRKGKSSYEIIDAAAEWGADKILIGAHGRDICPHSVLGSVSRTVVKYAPCSVEIIRQKQHLKAAASSQMQTAVPKA